MKEEYASGLLSLSWVKNFYIGFDGKKDRTWKIYITHDKCEKPLMEELQGIFGDKILYFVEFNHVRVASSKNGSSSNFFRGPRSGDQLNVTQRSDGGAISIISVGDIRTREHYAVTCYHVCYMKKLEGSIGQQHQTLKKDCRNDARGCSNATYEYTDGDRRKKLGTFYCGLYNEEHDIALVKLENWNCKDAVKYLDEKNVEKALASREEVFRMFKEMGGSVLVEKIGSDHSEGELFAIDARPWKNGMNRGSYGIRNVSSNKDFLVRGDSGSLLCMKCKDGRKVPFAYVSNKDGGAYYCPNLKESLEALNPEIKPCLGKCGLK
ncbi:uncharacterized protein LOC114526036 [Dendronephthya gigantea]|uniref:uncharacterized protein LOC114526036 n=1 Tax=Dendronephthya gigantea TaxID=151771 RepID=UPI00106BD319|nr:uncharacterized protein LOC114526036 [Dendronephthya gigantea]